MVSTEEKEILKSISAYIEKERREAGVPGLAVAIVRDGRRIWSEGFGHCELTQEKEVTPQTLFAIGSSTKAFTATAVAMLVEEGKLDWDTPVNRYLPGFRLKDSLAGERLTLRDMACHRSGLPRYDLSLFNPELNRKDLVDCLQHLEANHDFRTVWQYQNLMYATLGYIVGEITGTSWEDFVAERILDPLGMKQSNFSLAESQREAEYAFPSARKDGEIIELPWIEITATGPAGSINSTIEDMTNWLVLNLKQGKFGDEQLLAAESVKQLHTP
ncbi:MAG: serine hydrolase domain-containing protein, partial [Bacillota bacterium]